MGPNHTVVFLSFQVQSEQEKYILILHFLEFLGVNTMPYTSCSGQRVASSYLTNLDHPYHIILEHPRQVFPDMVGTSSVHTSVSNSDEGCPLQCNGLAFNCSSLDCRTGEVCEELQDLLSNIFTQLIALYKEPVRTNLLVLWLQHELCSLTIQQRTEKKHKKQVKAARKFAKKLLGKEENRNNLLLWEVFAKWEWSLGNKEDACKMLDMGLSFAKQLTETHHKRTIAQVVSTYTELLWTSGDHKDIDLGFLYILTKFCGQQHICSV